MNGLLHGLTWIAIAVGVVVVAVYLFSRHD